MNSIGNNGISSLFTAVNRITSQTVDAGSIRERRLNSENRSLSQENTRLISENLQLENRKNSLESENRDLEKEVDQLETDVSQLEQQLSLSEHTPASNAPSALQAAATEPGRIINTYA